MRQLAVEVCDKCKERLVCSWRGGSTWTCAACESAAEYPELSVEDIDALFEEDANG